MPRDGAIVFGDLIGKVDVLRVACDSFNCNRAGSYRIARLIEQHGHEAKIVDWLDRVTVSWNDRCSRQNQTSRN
jgi:hypothetical protein